MFASAKLERISLSNPVLQSYLYYATVLGIKMLALSIYTLFERFRQMAFVNPEDVARQKLKVRTDENVERVRRAHLNDLENIPVFFVIAFFYILTDPAPALATNLIRIYTAARIAHTFVYAVYVIPQPARGLSWGIGFIISIYMAVSCLLHFA